MSVPRVEQEWMKEQPGGSISPGEVMGWLFFTTSLLLPRVVIIAFWIFSDLLGDAYDGWVVPVLGFLLLPWTTISYAVMWSISSDRVSGWEWLVVALGVLLDVATYLGWRALRTPDEPARGPLPRFIFMG